MDMKKIEKLFANPSKEYRRKPFWAWNGKLLKGELVIIRSLGMECRIWVPIWFNTYK